LWGIWLLGALIDQVFLFWVVCLSKFVELSHLIEDGMDTYPGFPSPKIGAFLTREGSRPHYDGNAEFYIGSVGIVGNVGTYLDAPFHRNSTGMDLSQLPLDKVAGIPGLVIDAIPSGDRSLTIPNEL